MLATLADAPLKQRGLVYEPKYDGIRAIVELTPRPRARARLFSRNGNDKTAQFPAIVAALETAAQQLKTSVMLDGEIVALDERGRPAGFQRLQGRIHVTGSREAQRLDKTQPAALILFDFLKEGADDLCRLPLIERRAQLERLAKDLRLKPESTIRISEQVSDDGCGMHARAVKEHWEGLIVKEAAAPYQAGRRSPAWRKLKIVHEQEFVVAGWTEPRQTRSYFGALLLGVYQGDRLVYVGHTGTGFDQKELERVWKLLKARETRTSPFVERIKTNEPAHWVRPDLVAEVKFTEWTTDNKLRHPVYLGLRDDKPALEVAREGAKGARGAKGAGANSAKGAGAKGAEAAEGARADGAVIEALRALEDARRDGVLTLPNGDRLSVTNLSKPFWNTLKLTKGDLLRYYAQVAPFILPAVEDRPLVMKRFPNGVGGKAFYQQRSREERPPTGVRIETLPQGLDPITEPDAKRLVGGSLTTLLYMAQIAAISQDPWFSRVQSPADMDHAAIDLDPTDDTPFSRVLDVARWVRDELASLGVSGFAKTSGASGLHIYVPLPPHTSYESGMLFCQIVVTIVAARHSKTATVERMVARRPRGTVYVDFLQNILGKTLATAYSARASDYAGVSTPLTWDEVDEGVDPRDFTIRTAPARFASVGDLWAGLRDSKPADLEAVFRKYGKA
jgi:bifunctional non-homologous end joining protein LigD